MTTDQKGAIAELAVALAAMKLGIEVYRPVAEGGRYDMILDAGHELSASSANGPPGAERFSSLVAKVRVGARRG